METLLKLFGGLILAGGVAVIMAALLSGRKTPPPMGGAALILLLLCGGCATTKPLDHNMFPAGWERACTDGESQAVQWYARKYGSQPVNPYWELELIPDSRLPGDWAQCVSARRVIARERAPMSKRFEIIEHENRHRLNKANGKLDNEEAVK